MRKMIDHFKSQTRRKGYDFGEKLALILFAALHPEAAAVQRSAVRIAPIRNSTCDRLIFSLVAHSSRSYIHSAATHYR